MLGFLVFSLFSVVLLARQPRTNCKWKFSVWIQTVSAIRSWREGRGYSLLVTDGAGKAHGFEGSSAMRTGKPVRSPDVFYQVMATSVGLKGLEKILAGERCCVSSRNEMKLDVLKETLEVSACRKGSKLPRFSFRTIESPSTIEHAPNVNDRFESLLP